MFSFGTPVFMCTLFLLLLNWTYLSAFNLDTENIMRKTGDSGSLFGFSLAMHQQLNPDNRILLVGAPRAKALARQKANITGGLYSCSMSQSDKCVRVEFDNDADLSKESKENQWMGVTVNSQGPGGKVVTCAHRYEKRLFMNTVQESRDIIGRCYVLSQDLTVKDDMDGGDWRFCDGRLRGHEKFGSCQQGVAATFTRDYHYIMFGAPGTYNWKGVVRVEQKNQTFYEMDIFDDGPYEVGDESQRDETLVPVPANSYLGFSLDSGRGITSMEGMTFVSGAPRANHSGAVVMLKKDDPNSRRLVPEYILEGEGLASSFGYDIAVVDLNSDRWQDIVVGAPQYFEKGGEIGGAVYIYINNKGKWDTVKPIRLNGAKDSMFGLSVENIGDINQDGFPDIAVGAPYDDNMGKVYIYHGSRDGINMKPAQIIDGNSLGRKFFGYSIVGNMDLDLNTYPDIAVGTLSDSVFIFRSRPVVSIIKKIKNLPPSIDLNKKTCADGSGICMSVEACFSYIANPPGYNPLLTVIYTFEAETDRKNLGLQPRVVFIGGSSDKYVGELKLKEQNKEICVKANLKLQENIQDKLRPIPITVGVEIKKTSRKRRQSGSLPDLFPVLNANEPSTVRADVNFLKEGCGLDNICQSNLKMQYQLCTGSKDKFEPLPEKDGIRVLYLKDQKNIAVNVTVTNIPSNPGSKDGDDAHEAKLIVTFPETLSYASVRHLKLVDRPIQCDIRQNASQAECELGNPFKRGSEVTFLVVFGTSNIFLETTELNITLALQTTSEQKDLTPVTVRALVFIQLLLSLSGAAKPSQVYFGGSVTGESGMNSEDDIGSLITYEFRIINLGKPLKTLDAVVLDIKWPKEIKNGKWLLYLMKIESEGLEKLDCSPKSDINALNVKKSSETTRKKRQAGSMQSDDGRKLSYASDKRKYLTLDCDGMARCVNIQCPLRGLDSNAVIFLRSRLWNATFLEEYAKLNYLDVIVKASINIVSNTTNIGVADAATQVRLTVFPEKPVAQYGGVPWWIIFVAVLAGILLLALLVFLLWKCGFFGRSKKDQYDTAAYHKAEIHVQPSDKERLTTDA
ncbi:integrin alpha-6 isoform X2 [Protopterus annectens]|uniref:integrin alpha-6 isoform X2 n=1 Tax=Protopterus annectens TaxID=7888 RepID=UPI001CFAB80E|nr:integrin alpha-6 isoform X2 [Protopterus annectens]